MTSLFILNKAHLPVGRYVQPARDDMDLDRCLGLLKSARSDNERMAALLLVLCACALMGVACDLCMNLTGSRDGRSVLWS